MNFSWSDIDEIAYQLTEAHPSVAPAGVKFTDLRAMVEALEGFAAEEGHSVNEQILEAIQANWIEEVEDAGGVSDDAGDDDPTYSPNQPFR